MALLTRRSTATPDTPPHTRESSLQVCRAVTDRIEHEISILRADLEGAQRVTADLAHRLADAQRREAALHEAIASLAHERDVERRRHEIVLRTCEDPRVVAFGAWLDTEFERIIHAVDDRVETGRSVLTGERTHRVVSDNRASVDAALAAIRVCRSALSVELPYVAGSELDAAIAQLKQSIPAVEPAA